MGLAELFEFKAEQEILGGMTEEEFKRRATDAIQKLRNFCRKLGGRFTAHSENSATCVFPEGIEIQKIRATEVRKGGVFLRKGHYLEIFPSRTSEVFDLVVDDGVDVYIGGNVLVEAQSARLTSGRGGEVEGLGGRMRVDSIYVKTDEFGRRVYVEIL